MTGTERSLSPELRRTARRIGVQTAGLLMVCLIVVGTVLYIAVVRSQDDQMTSSLVSAVASAGTSRNHDTDDRPRSGGIASAVLNARGLQTSGDVPPGLPDLEVMRQVATTQVPDRRTVNLRVGSYELLTVRRGDDTVQIIASRFEQHQERERILRALVVAGVAGLVLAGLAAVVLARRAVRPITQALELQRRFVADAGHELRTPLTLLSTRAQLLARRVRDRSLPPEEREQLITRDASGIVADTAALTGILEELLLAADTRTPVAQELVDLATLVSSAAESAQAVAHQAGVTLTVDLTRTARTQVAGAPIALARSVAALIDNALDHAAQQVSVSVHREGRSVVVEVLDDGPGISAATLPRMFDRFSSDRPQSAGAQAEPSQAERFQAERPQLAHKGQQRHFGLGLALVSEIANRHGGSVTATNRRPPLRGAALRLVIPSRSHPTHQT